MCSAEPGESWGWCYRDSTRLEPAADDDLAEVGVEPQR